MSKAFTEALTGQIVEWIRKGEIELALNCISENADDPQFAAVVLQNNTSATLFDRNIEYDLSPLSYCGAVIGGNNKNGNEDLAKLLQLAEAMIAAGADPNYKTSYSSETMKFSPIDCALFECINYRDIHWANLPFVIDFVKLMVKARAEVKDIFERNEYLISSFSIDLVQVLIDAGAVLDEGDMNYESGPEDDVLEFAEDEADSEWASDLEKNGVKPFRSLLSVAVHRLYQFNGDIEAYYKLHGKKLDYLSYIQFLIDLGLNIDHPLTAALSIGKVDVVMLLLENGAEPVDERDALAICACTAQKEGNEDAFSEIFEMLLGMSKNIHKRKPVSLLAKLLSDAKNKGPNKGLCMVIDKLFKAGVSIKNDPFAFAHACKTLNKEVVKKCIANGAEINALSPIFPEEYDEALNYDTSNSQYKPIWKFGKGYQYTALMYIFMGVRQSTFTSRNRDKHLLETVKYLIEEGADPSFVITKQHMNEGLEETKRDGYGEGATALSIAVANGCNGSAEFLINIGVDFSYGEDSNAFLLAIIHKNYQLAERLLNFTDRFDINQIDSQQRSAIGLVVDHFNSSSQRDMKNTLVFRLLQHGASPIQPSPARSIHNVGEIVGSIPTIVKCASQYQWSLLKYMLENFADEFGKKHYELILICALMQNAEPSYQKGLDDEDLNTFLQNSGDLDTVYVCSGRTVLTQAARSSPKYLELVLEVLSEKRIEPNRGDGNGDTCILSTIQERNQYCLECLQLSLLAGVDPNVTFRADGATSLMLASGLPNCAVRHSFMPKRTALVYRAKNCTPIEILELLVENGGDYKATDAQGLNAFHYACRGGIPEIIDWYLNTIRQSELDFMLNHPARETGYTPAMYLATTRGCGAILRKMVTLGCKVSGTASDGSTTLSIAVRERSDLYLLLRELGADPTEGIHPLVEATRLRPQNVVLLQHIINFETINAEVAQEALDNVLAKYGMHDPFEDFRCHEPCGTSFSMMMDQLRRDIERRIPGIVEQLVSLGARRKNKNYFRNGFADFLYFL